MGLLVAIEGIDGSGKGTQAKRLTQRLLERGLSAELFSFPQYTQNRMGARIGDFLNGRFGQLDEVAPFLASLLYSLDRFESRERLTTALAENDVVVCDRFTGSNLAHQGAKLPHDVRDESIREMEWVEHELLGTPAADLTVLLRLPVATARGLIRAKAPRDYTDQTEDLQEADADYLSKVAEAYADLAESRGWCMIDCEGPAGLFSVEEIGKKIEAEVLKCLERQV